MTGHSVPGLHADWPRGAVSAPWEYATAAQGQSGIARVAKRSNVGPFEDNNKPTIRYTDCRSLAPPPVKLSNSLYKIYYSILNQISRHYKHYLLLTGPPISSAPNVFPAARLSAPIVMLSLPATSAAQYVISKKRSKSNRSYPDKLKNYEVIHVVV